MSPSENNLTSRPRRRKPASIEHPFAAKLSTVATMQISDTAQLRVSVHRGRHCADVRLFTRVGEVWRSLPVGVRIRDRHIAALIRGLHLARRELGLEPSQGPR